jgi:hypothetical protein
MRLSATDLYIISVLGWCVIFLEKTMGKDGRASLLDKNDMISLSCCHVDI